MTRKYIDADKLKAEIERRIEETKSMKPAFDQFWAGQISAFKGVIKIIDSLQQGQPSLPSNLDEAAEETAKKYYCSCLEKHNETGICDGCENVKLTFKAGAEWYDNQMKMPNSSELISAWHGVKSILQEKDFRGDEWRLAYNAFMFGFSRGINTQKTEK